MTGPQLKLAIVMEEIETEPNNEPNLVLYLKTSNCSGNNTRKEKSSIKIFISLTHHCLHVCSSTIIYGPNISKQTTTFMKTDTF